MSTEEDIELALFKRMKSLVFTPSLEIAWPNMKFDPSDTYARVDHLRNSSARLFLKGSDPHGHLGIFQVTIVSKLNEGTASALSLAGQVVSHFTADLKLYEGAVKVRISKKPDVATPLRTDTSWEIVVSIPYESYV